METTFGLILLSIITIFNVIPFVLQLLSPPPIKPLSFENDITFLNYLIGIEIKDYEKYVITPSKAAGRALMSDTELKEYREGMSIRIYSRLSSNYKKVLYKYFTNESLIEYITNTVNNELTDRLLKYNFSFINKGTMNSDFTNVKQTDIEQ